MADDLRECVQLMYQGDIEAVRCFLTKHADHAEFKHELLCMASEKGLVGMMEEIIQAGALVHKFGVLQGAINSKNADAVACILRHGVSVNTVENGVIRCPSLQRAIKKGSLDIVKMLVEHGACLDDNPVYFAKSEAQSSKHSDEEKRRRTEIVEYLQTVVESPPAPIKSFNPNSLGTRTAALLSGEVEYLSRVVDDLSDEEAKRAYADWLSARCDARGEFLARWVANGRTNDLIAGLRSDTIPPVWQRMIGVELESWIVEKKLEQHRNVLFRLARPAIAFNRTIVQDQQIPIGMSKVGGQPDLSPNVSWPREKDCTDSYGGQEHTDLPCGFWGQINLAELRGTLAARFLPERGMLSFFFFMDFSDGRDGIRVLFDPAPKNLVRMNPPGPLIEATQIAPTQAVRFSETLVMPEVSGPWKNEMAPVAELDWHERFENDGDFMGYDWATTGDDPTPDRESRFLLLMNPHVRFHLQIREDDLKACNFDAVKIVWIDYD